MISRNFLQSSKSLPFNTDRLPYCGLAPQYKFFNTQEQVTQGTSASAVPSQITPHCPEVLPRAKVLHLVNPHQCHRLGWAGHCRTLPPNLLQSPLYLCSFDQLPTSPLGSIVSLSICQKPGSDCGCSSWGSALLSGRTAHSFCVH